MTLLHRYESPRGSVRIWRCDQCGKLFEWHEGAEWYGSYMDVDSSNWEKIVVVCSPECKAARLEDSQDSD